MLAARPVAVLWATTTLRTITLRTILAMRATVTLVTALLLLFALGDGGHRRPVRRSVDGRGHRGRRLMLTMAMTVARLMLLTVLRTALRPPHLDHLGLGGRRCIRCGFRRSFGSRFN